MSNRRDFVATTLATSAVLNGLVTLPAAAAAPGSFGSIPNKAVFDTLTGQMLEVHASGRYQADLRLAAVHDRSCCAHWQQFSLALRGGTGQSLPGGIYRLGHKTTGRFQLRLDPAGADAQGPIYRADLTQLA